MRLDQIQKRCPRQEYYDLKQNVMNTILFEAGELLHQDAKAWRTLRENPEAFLDEVTD